MVTIGQSGIEKKNEQGLAISNLIIVQWYRLLLCGLFGCIYLKKKRVKACGGWSCRGPGAQTPWCPGQAGPREPGTGLSWSWLRQCVVLRRVEEEGVCTREGISLAGSESEEWYKLWMWRAIWEWRIWWMKVRVKASGGVSECAWVWVKERDWVKVSVNKRRGEQWQKCEGVKAKES